MLDWLLDWFGKSFTNSTHLKWYQLTGCLLLSLLFGVIVAGIYVWTQRKTRTELLPFATTIVLLTVLISMVTLVIGENLARAFSLAGALAIIRFRTVVEDTRDTAFVIFAVAVGMGIGAEMAIVPLIGTPILGVAALALSYCGKRSTTAGPADYLLSIRLGLGRDPGSILQELFAKHLTKVRLRATTTARQGAALDLNYLVRLRKEEDAVTFVTDLNKIEGVQSVELRQM